MVWYGKLLAVLIIGGLLTTSFKRLAIVVICLVVLYYLIRWGADIFWWGKDNKKW